MTKELEQQAREFATKPARETEPTKGSRRQLIEQIYLEFGIEEDNRDCRRLIAIVAGRAHSLGLTEADRAVREERMRLYKKFDRDLGSTEDAYDWLETEFAVEITKEQK